MAESRTECRSIRVIFGIYLAPVGLCHRAHAVQSKRVVALADFPNRLKRPALGGQVKSAFWLLKGKKESVLVHLRNRSKGAPITIVTESIGKELYKHFLQKLRINTQHRAADLNVPGDCRFVPGEIMID